FYTALWVRPPLYVLLLGGIVRFAGTNYLAPLLVQSLLSALTLLPLAWLACRVAGWRAARFAAALAALYLPFTLFSGLLLSETLFLLLFALSLVALVRARETLSLSSGALIMSGVAGLLLGLTVL